MTETQKQEVLEEYIGNEMSKLRKVVIPKALTAIGGMEQKEYDDLLGDVCLILMEVVNSYDENKCSDFHGYFINCLNKRLYTQVRDRNRDKRKANYGCNVCSIDNESEDGLSLIDMMAGKETIEDIIFTENMSDKVEKYINELPRVARQIILLKINGNKKDYIVKQLHITGKQYADAMNVMKASKYISILL